MQNSMNLTISAVSSVDASEAFNYTGRHVYLPFFRTKCVWHKGSQSAEFIEELTLQSQKRFPTEFQNANMWGFMINSVKGNYSSMLFLARKGHTKPANECAKLDSNKTLFTNWLKGSISPKSYSCPPWVFLISSPSYICQFPNFPGSFYSLQFVLLYHITKWCLRPTSSKWLIKKVVFLCKLFRF
jgi:hypothetical protein